MKELDTMGVIISTGRIIGSISPHRASITRTDATLLQLPVLTAQLLVIWVPVCLPQMGEGNTPQPSDAAGEPLLYDMTMTRVYLADGRAEERSALRYLLLDLNLEVIGEAADWLTTIAQAPLSRTDMLLVDWDLLPSSPTAAFDELRKACPAALVIVLISHLDARHQAALSAGADAFISKGETPERVVERLRAVAARVSIN